MAKTQLQILSRGQRQLWPKDRETDGDTGLGGDQLDVWTLRVGVSGKEQNVTGSDWAVNRDGFRIEEYQGFSPD